MVTCDQDFSLWTKQQADLLRQGRWNEIDASNIAEELEDMGSSRELELESRLGVLLAHLLKWRYQLERHGKSGAPRLTNSASALPGCWPI